MPIFDHKLVQDAQTKASGQDIHGLKTRLALYINEFKLVDSFNKNWTDITYSGMTREQLVDHLAREIRQKINAD